MKTAAWTDELLDSAIRIHRGIENGARLTIEDVEAEIEKKKKLLDDLEAVRWRHQKAGDRLCAVRRRQLAAKGKAA